MVAGAVSFANDLDNQIVNVKDILTPTRYNEDRKLFGKDIAILVLKKDLRFYAHVKMIDLPPENYRPPGKNECFSLNEYQIGHMIIFSV